MIDDEKILPVWQRQPVPAKFKPPRGKLFFLRHKAGEGCGPAWTAWTNGWRFGQIDRWREYEAGAHAYVYYWRVYHEDWSRWQIVPPYGTPDPPAGKACTLAQAKGALLRCLKAKRLRGKRKWAKKFLASAGNAESGL